MKKAEENFRSAVTSSLRSPDSLPEIWHRAGGAFMGTGPNDVAVFPGPDNPDVVEALLLAVYEALPSAVLQEYGALEAGPILRGRISDQGTSSLVFLYVQVAKRAMSF